MTSTPSSPTIQPRLKKPRAAYDLTCPIGLATLETEVTFPCGHYVCGSCWGSTVARQCPLCRAAVPIGWKPKANQGLRRAINNAERTARCGKKLKLSALRIHRRSCIACVKAELAEQRAETEALTTRVNTLTTALERGEAMNNLLTVELHNYTDMFHQDQFTDMYSAAREILNHVHESGINQEVATPPRASGQENNSVLANQNIPTPDWHTRSDATPPATPPWPRRSDGARVEQPAWHRAAFREEKEPPSPPRRPRPRSNAFDLEDPVVRRISF